MCLYLSKDGKYGSVLFLWVFFPLPVGIKMFALSFLTPTPAFSDSHEFAVVSHLPCLGSLEIEARIARKLPTRLLRD